MEKKHYRSAKSCMLEMGYRSDLKNDVREALKKFVD